jgi:hypothetical protein
LSLTASGWEIFHFLFPLWKIGTHVAELNSNFGELCASLSIPKKNKRIKIIEFSHATTFYFAMRHAEKLPRICAMVLCFSHQQLQIKLELVTAVPDTVFLKMETMC